MSLRPFFAALLTQFLRLEMLVILGILICLWALLQPPARAQRRVVQLPVRLVVSDAETGLAIVGAQLRIFAVGSDLTPESLRDRREDYERWRAHPIGRGTTNYDGVLEGVYQFSRFIPLSEYWVEVESDDGAMVAVPLGREKTQMGRLPETEEITVTIGLHRDNR